MKKVFVLCEGFAEEMFIKEVLAPHLAEGFQVFLTPIIVETRRDGNGLKFKGGVSRKGYDKLRSDLLKLLGDSSVDLVTTFFDLYRLPENIPGEDGVARKGLAKALHLEQAWAVDIPDRRFKPYIQLHEFEALLFSDPTAFAYWAYSQDVIDSLCEIARRFDTPEDINESPATAPSKRIIAVVEAEMPYQKVVQGSVIALEIGLPAIRAACPHFNEWVRSLEQLEVSR